MAGLPDRNEQYSKQEYWEQRYKAEFDSQPGEYTFDWFKTYQDISNLIHEIVPNRSSRILMLGCGNSKLSEEYSPAVIDMMKRRHQTLRPCMEWHVMDVRGLRFDDITFDVTIDKGTMDAMLAVKGSLWDPPVDAIESCNKEVEEAMRVLKPQNGVFLYLTFGQPHFRRRYFQGPHVGSAQLEIRQLGNEDAFHYYAYILKNSENA